MTGQDFQEKLDAIVQDLQTVGKGQTVEITFRHNDNGTGSFQLSSDAAGVVHAVTLANVQGYINVLKTLADNYTAQLAPVTAASEAFRLASVPHEALAEAARVARLALSTAQESDPAFQAAKTALDNARNTIGYINAREYYRLNNVSENFGNLSDAKGKYLL